MCLILAGESRSVRDCAYCGDVATSYIPERGDVCEACKDSILREEDYDE